MMEDFFELFQDLIADIEKTQREAATPTASGKHR